MSAASALIEMSAERGGATPRNRQEHFDVLPADPLTASFDECVSRSADQIGHLEGWPVHLLIADPRLLRVDVWRSSASAYVGARLSAGPLAGRLSCKRPRPLWW